MKLEQLTFTRYIAALSVVFFHYGNQVFPANLPFVHPILTAGPIAVSYFYVLSGFIMAIAYYRQESNKPFPRNRYWLARIARIYPIYLLALLLMIAAQRQGNGSDPIAVLLNLTMTQAWIPGYPLTLNAPGWSLSVETFFYLMFPLLILTAKHHHLKKLAIFSIIFWALTQLLHIILLNTASYQPFSHLHDLIYYNPIMHLNTFMMGFIAGVWMLDGRLQALNVPAINVPGLLLTLLVILILLVIRTPIINHTGINIDYTNGMIAPLFLIFIVLLSLNTSGLSQWMRHKWMILLGEASFSMYILQRPLHGIYEKITSRWIDSNSELSFYLFVCVLTGVAILSFLFIESPSRHFINAFGSSSDKTGSHTN